MRAPRFWNQPPGLLSFLLAPLGWAYGALAGRRMRRRGERPGVPVICIGNFTAGGTGKTPTAAAIGAALKARGFAPAFVSRGYGGKLSGPEPVKVDAATHTSAEVGDEPLLLARVAPTYICADRAAGARRAIAEGANLIILDDGLQNQGLAKDFTIAVVDGAVGLGNGACIPAGPLRAPMAAQWPAVQAVLIVGEGSAGKSLAAEAASRAVPVFAGRLVPDPVMAGAIAGQRVFAFAGIGRPEKFFQTVRETGAEVMAVQAFPDHHRFSDADLRSLAQIAKSRGVIPVTTEKDAMRLPPKMRDNVVALPVTMDIDGLDQLAASILAHAGRPSG